MDVDVSAKLNIMNFEIDSKAQSLRIKNMNQTLFFCVYREIQKLVAFLVVFLGAYLCQILKEIDMICLVSFAFLVHVLI